MNLYVSFYSVDHVTEVDLATLAKTRELNIGSDYAVDAIIIDGYLYVGLDVAAPGGQIVKIDLWTFTEVDRLTLDADEVGMDSGIAHAAFAYDGLRYLYVVIDRPTPGVDGVVLKIDLNTFAKVDKLNLTTRWPNPIISGNYLYIVHGVAAPAEITKIDLTTFTIVDVTTVSHNYPQDMVVVGDYMYIGHSVNPAIITKVNLTTFTEDSFITFPAGEGWCWAIVSDGTYLYCGMSTNPGRIIRVDIATFLRVDAITFNPGENDTWWLGIDGDNLWAVLENTPTTIIKIDIPTFTRVGSLDLDAAEGDSWASALGTPTIPYVINKAYALAREEL